MFVLYLNDNDNQHRDGLRRRPTNVVFGTSIPFPVYHNPFSPLRNLPSVFPRARRLRTN
jgi:hypothetical protein